MTEVEYGGRGHHTRLRNDLNDQLSMGCPLPQYIKDGGGGGRPRHLVRPGCGVLLGLQGLVGVHQEGRKGEGSGGVGKVAGPLFPSPIRTRGEGGRSSLFPLPIKAHQGPLLLP